MAELCTQGGGAGKGKRVVLRQLVERRIGSQGWTAVLCFCFFRCVDPSHAPVPLKHVLFKGDQLIVWSQLLADEHLAGRRRGGRGVDEEQFGCGEPCAHLPHDCLVVPVPLLTRQPVHLGTVARAVYFPVCTRGEEMRYG